MIFSSLAFYTSLSVLSSVFCLLSYLSTVLSRFSRRGYMPGTISPMRIKCKVSSVYEAIVFQPSKDCLSHLSPLLMPMWLISMNHGQGLTRWTPKRVARILSFYLSLSHLFCMYLYRGQLLRTGIYIMYILSRQSSKKILSVNQVAHGIWPFCVDNGFVCRTSIQATPVRHVQPISTPNPRFLLMAQLHGSGLVGGLDGI